LRQIKGRQRSRLTEACGALSGIKEFPAETPFIVVAKRYIRD